MLQLTWRKKPAASRAYGFCGGVRKRRTRSETLSIDDVALLLGEGERRRQEPGPEAQKDEAIHAVELIYLLFSIYLQYAQPDFQLNQESA